MRPGSVASDLDGHEALGRRIYLEVVDRAPDRVLEDVPVRIHPDAAVDEDGQAGPEPAQPELRIARQGPDPLEEDQHP